MSVQYLDKTGLAHFWDKIKSYVIKENTRIPFAQVDGTSTSKIYTVTVPEITELTDGVCLYLMNGVVTSESGFTVNVNNLGAKPVYSTLSAASRATTLFNINYTLLLVYNSHRVTGGCWDAYYGYDSNTNTIGYQLRTTSSSLPMKSITYRYRLLFTSADRAHYVPANNSSSTNATSSRAVCQDPIDPFGEIRYYGTTASVAADARPAVANLWEQYGITLGYSFNRTGAALVLTQWYPVYVKCTPQSDGSAIIDADTPYVQTLPSTEDGKIYIFLGIAYSDTQVELVMNHPVYWYKDGMIRPYTNASASGGVTSWNGQTGAVTYTAPVTSVNGNTGAVTVTEGLAPLIGTTSTVTPQQVMTALGEGRDICISATGEIAQVPLVLKFTNFNRATDSVYAGNAIDVAVSQTIAAYNGAFYLFELIGGTLSTNPYPWEVIQTNLATLSNLDAAAADLWGNFVNYVPNEREVNGKALSADITLTASDILPSVTSSDAGKFLRVNSSGSWAVEAVQSAESEAY